MTLARNAADQERLIDYVRVALARIDAGEEVDPNEICADHPHLARSLGEVLGLTEALPGLQEAALRDDPLAGLVLADRYRLIDCLGRGAMGVVYQGEDQELQRSVAIKILDARLFRDPQAEQRFQREAEALAALQHSNVVAVFDRGRTPEGIHFLVMELLDGLTMAAMLERTCEAADPLAAVGEAMGRPASETHWAPQCARWALQIARGLGAAHARGLVHRDVKPSNIFLVKPGRPVVIDFGIAARADDERLTATQTTLGTPWYMPPEQIASGGIVSAAPTFDVYGLGATLYHLLGGHPPYEGDAAAVLAALQHHDPKPLLRVRPDLPRDLVAIVEKSLEREPSRRYPDASALANDLDAFLAYRPVGARPISPLTRRIRHWRRAPSKPIAVAAVGATVVVAAVAAAVWSEQRETRRQREKDQLYATLPSVLAIEGWPDERVLRELRDEHETAIQLLDSILELDPNDLPVRLWRASLQLDLGNRDAAIADLDAIAGQSDSPYFSELARRYAASDTSKSGAYAIDTSNLPQPNTPQEMYVAGFHELRNRHVEGFEERANALLEPAAEHYLPARDLRLLAIAALGRFEELLEETIVLETIYGGQTARTQAMRGVAMLRMGRTKAAVRAFRRSLELRPERHGPHQNLGVAFRQLGMHDEAEHHLLEAQRLRPFAANTATALAQLARDRGNFAEAYARAEKIPKTGVRGEEWKQPLVVGNIAFHEAMHWRGQDEHKRMQAAQRAAASYRECLEHVNSRRARQRLAIAEALTNEAATTGLVAFAEQLIPRDPETDELRLDAPADSYELTNLAVLMASEGLDPTQTAWIAAIIRKLARENAGGDIALRKQLADEISAGLDKVR